MAGDSGSVAPVASVGATKADGAGAAADTGARSDGTNPTALIPAYGTYRHGNTPHVKAIRLSQVQASTMPTIRNQHRNIHPRYLADDGLNGAPGVNAVAVFRRSARPGLRGYNNFTLFPLSKLHLIRRTRTSGWMHTQAGKFCRSARPTGQILPIGTRPLAPPTAPTRPDPTGPRSVPPALQGRPDSIQIGRLRQSRRTHQQRNVQWIDTGPAPRRQHLPVCRQQTRIVQQGPHPVARLLAFIRKRDVCTHFNQCFNQSCAARIKSDIA